MTHKELPIDLFRGFLTENDWPWMQEDKSTLVGMIGGDNGNWRWRFHCLSDGELLVLLSTVPVSVPRRRRAAAMEYVTRANWGLAIATFEMDLSDGQVSCRTSVPGSAFTRGAITYFVSANFATMDRYLPGLMAVIYGNASPRQAIAEAEAVEPEQQEGPGGEKAVGISDPDSTDPEVIPKQRNPAIRRGRLFSADN